MTDEATNGASAPVADAAAPLKSNDTSEMKVIQQLDQAEPEKKPEPKVEPEADDSDPEVDEEHDAPEAGSDDKPKQGKSGWKKRLERVRRQVEAETKERIYQELHEKQYPAPPTSEPAESAKSWEEFLEENDFDQSKALKAFYQQEREAERAAEARRAEEEQHAKAAETIRAKVEEFEERVGEGAMDEIKSSPLNTDAKYKPLVDMFMGDENTLDIAYELANNLEEADRLLSLPPLARVRELAKLAEKFGGAPQKPAPVLPPKKTTNAPPPPKTVAGSGKSIVDLDDPSITPAQRIAEWKRKEKR